MQQHPGNTAVAVRQNEEKTVVEFVPFGEVDKIKLTLSLVINTLAVKTRSGKVCSEQDALKFMMLCRARHLNPWAGDAFLTGYDTQDGPKFSLITAHQVYLKRAEASPIYEGMDSGIIILLDEDSGKVEEREGDFHLRHEIVVGGWAKVHTTKQKKPTYRRIRMDRFNTGNAQWKVDPAGMIVKCAEADALRSTFPTLLGGLVMEGERSNAIDTPGASSGAAPAPAFETPMKRARVTKAATVTVDTSRPAETAPAQTAAPQQEAEPEPEPQQPADGEQQAEGDQNTEQEATEKLTCYQELRQLCVNNNVTEAQVMAHLKAKVMTHRNNTTIDQVAEATVNRLIGLWPTVVEAIRKL